MHIVVLRDLLFVLCLYDIYDFRQLFVSGVDLHKVDLAITSSVSAVNISRLSMSPGVRYYSNVVANTLSGLQTTVSSDGIMVDSTSPVSGTVTLGVLKKKTNLNIRNKNTLIQTIKDYF
jgi:hypothetical protein